MHIYIPIWLIVVTIIALIYAIMVFRSRRCPMGGFHDTIEDDDFHSPDGPVGPAEYYTKCKKWL